MISKDGISKTPGYGSRQRGLSTLDYNLGDPANGVSAGYAANGLTVVLTGAVTGPALSGSRSGRQRDFAGNSHSFRHD